MCPRIGGRRDRPNSPRTLLLQLSGLEDIFPRLKAVNLGRCARRRPHTRPLGFPGSLRNSLEPPQPGLYTSTNRRCPEFRDHVNFDARAEWHLRHTDGTAGMNAPLAEHLDK